MPDLTLQTGDDLERLTGPSSEAGVEAGLAERMTKALADIGTLIEEVPVDDPAAEELRVAAMEVTSVALGRFPSADRRPVIVRQGRRMVDPAADETRDVASLDVLVESVERIVSTIGRHIDGLDLRGSNTLYGPIYGIEGCAEVLRELLRHLSAVAQIRHARRAGDEIRYEGGARGLDLVDRLDGFGSVEVVQVHGPDGERFRIVGLDVVGGPVDDVLVIELAEVEQ